MTCSKPIVLIGAGGHAREVAEIIAHSRRELGTPGLKGFLDQSRGLHGRELDGFPVLGDLDWLREHTEEVDVIVTIGDNTVRKRVVEEARALGATFVNAISPLAHLSQRCQIGVGVMVFPGVVVSTNTVIGNHVILGTHSGMSHDSVVGDYGFLCPGARITGGVTLGEGVMMGTNSSVIPCRSVGSWSIVGAGGAVVHDLPNGVTAVGVPAVPKV